MMVIADIGGFRKTFDVLGYPRFIEVEVMPPLDVMCGGGAVKVDVNTVKVRLYATHAEQGITVYEARNP